MKRSPIDQFLRRIVSSDETVWVLEEFALSQEA